MFDTMTIVKVGGGFLGAFLFFLLGNWAASGLYSNAPAHGAEEHAAGYHIEVSSGDAKPVEAAAAVPFADLLAAADPAKGEKVFGKCKSCHKLEDGVNATGPSLYGVVGRPVGTEAGFEYSDAVKGLGGDWTPERLNDWLSNPKSYAPGNKMTFAGLKKENDRANLIAYLETIGG